MKPELDMDKPVTVTASKLGPEYIELNLRLTDGEKVNVPMKLLSAKGIGLTLTTIADRLIAKAGQEAIEFDIQDTNLN